MSYQQTQVMGHQDAVILKFFTATSTDVTETQAFAPAEDEPLIYSLVDYLPAGNSTSMPPLFQIELIEAQYSQFMEEIALQGSTSNRAWDKTIAAGIRAM